MFHSFTMQSTDGTEIWPIYPNLFTQLVRFGSVLCRECTVESFIQDSEVFDIHWQPISVEPGRHCNWWEHEIIT